MRRSLCQIAALFLESRGIRTHQTIDDLALLDENKCRHSTDNVLGSSIGILIHVHLEKDDVGHVLRKLLEERCNHLAWAAPYIRESRDVVWVKQRLSEKQS